MLAGRCLPPIERSSPFHQVPVATFFNIPRRYIRSNMQLGDSPASSPNEDSKPSLTRNLRKSNRINDAKGSPTSHPQPREALQSPDSTSPQSLKKKLATLREEPNGEQPSKQGNPQELPSPTSATSLTSGEHSPQVCLCQPEPKIPRPRNGESFGLSSLCSALFHLKRRGVTRGEQRAHSLFVGSKVQAQQAADTQSLFSIYPLSSTPPTRNHQGESRPQ